MKKLKISFYLAAKWLGIFLLFRRLTKNKLRILCYHGVSLDKEHTFFDKLFITRETYQKRMQYLKNLKYPVISLDQAIKMLPSEEYPECATVITFDDGWSGVYSEISEMMEEFNFPWTLYISTYYMNKQTQVFNIVFQYLLGTTSKKQVELNLHNQSTATRFALSTSLEKENFYQEISEFANTKLNSTERQNLLKTLSITLDVDSNWIFDKECFKYITPEQLKLLHKRGVDMQLHTHRHIFPPNDLECSRKEVLENRLVIEELVDQPATHFCYPSGVYSSNQFSLLESLGVESATTVKSGLNDKKTNKYELLRFLDSESINQVEFEAEMSGFAPFIRSTFR